MSFFDASIPAENESVKLGAQRIRDLKTWLNATLGLWFTNNGSNTFTLNTNAIPGSALANNSVTATQLGAGAVTPAAVTPGAYSYALATGALAGNTYIVTLVPALPALVAGAKIQFIADAANTGAVSVNVNSLGAKTIKKSLNVDLAAGEIASGQAVVLIYDGTNWQLAATGTPFATSAEVATGTSAIKAVTPAALSAQRHVTGLNVMSGGGQIIGVAHGLSSIPSFVRWVLVCSSGGDPATGYAAGDEIDVNAVTNNTPESHATMTPGADGTSVFLAISPNSNGFQINGKSAGNSASMTQSQWKAKCYYSL